MICLKNEKCSNHSPCPFCALVHARGCSRSLQLPQPPPAANVRRTSARVAALHRLCLYMDEIRPHYKEKHPAFVKNRMAITFTLCQLHAPDRSQSAIFLDSRPKTLRHEAYASATMRTTGATTQNRTIVSTMDCVFDSCGNTDCSAETAFRAALLTLLLSHSPP